MSTLGLHPIVRRHARSRPMPIVGRCYRNGAGQVRRLVAVRLDTSIVFEIIQSGPHPKTTNQYPVGYQGQMLLNSFRSWYGWECDESGTVIPHPELRAPRANTKHLLAALAEALEAAS